MVLFQHIQKLTIFTFAMALVAMVCSRALQQVEQLVNLYLMDILQHWIFLAFHLKDLKTMTW